MKPSGKKDLLKALRANHQWHIDNDDHDGYPGSDLEVMNLAAIDRAEGALAERQPDADGWIVWNGGPCPVKRGIPHQVKTRNGWVSPVDFDALGWCWMHDVAACEDIVAYRIVEGGAV